MCPSVIFCVSGLLMMIARKFLNTEVRVGKTTRGNGCYSFIHLFIHSVFCLTTGPYSLPKQELGSRASCFSLRYPLVSLRQGWGTCDTHYHSGTRKSFLGTRHSLLSQFFFISFARPASLYCEECVYIYIYIYIYIARQAEVALGVPGGLRPRIFSTFGTTRVVGRQLNAPAAFTPWEIPGTHFQRLSRPQGTWFCRKEPRKKSQVTPQEIGP